MPAASDTEIQDLRAEIRRMQQEESKYLRAIGEWKEQVTWIQARLKQMEKLLSPDAEQPTLHSPKAHRARSGSS